MTQSEESTEMLRSAWLEGVGVLLALPGNNKQTAPQAQMTQSRKICTIHHYKSILPWTIALQHGPCLKEHPAGQMAALTTILSTYGELYAQPIVGLHKINIALDDAHSAEAVKKEDD